MKARNLCVRLGKRDVLQDIALDARAGQITAIVGPNGSGKSTLLKALTGEIPATGDLWLNDRALQDFPAWELAACRGVLQQALTVAFPFTVEEVVRLGHAAGIAATDPGVPEQALAAVDLASFAPRPYHQLSGGEQQRTHIARVLAQVWPHPGLTGPRWLFMDEPVSSLDFGHQFVVMDRMADFAAQGGGVITVMHDLNLTAMYADHVILVKSGRVLAAGPVAEVLTEQNLSTAYNCPVRVSTPAPAPMPYILPQARLAAASGNS